MSEPAALARFRDSGEGWALSLADRAALRRYAAPTELSATAVAVHLAEGPAPLSLVPPADWPLTSIRARRVEPGWLTVLRFSAPVAVDAVVRELARQAVWRERPVLGRRPRLDPRILNPTGFEVAASDPVVRLSELDLREGVTAALVASLRPALGVEVDVAVAPEVTGALAMAGVPLTGDGQGAEGSDLADPLAREELSVEQRRAAHARHAPLTQPSVSIVLATMRPENLGFALRQVARQRGVDRLQLVLAPHGFEPDPALVADTVGAGVDVRIRAQARETLFGDVLDAAARSAEGEVVVKMDDDDWYGRDVITDLLLARSYSGAELVGMPAEFHHLTGEGVTVKRGHPVELYARFVAGGTMMVDASMLRAVGGFRSVRKYVDAQLLAAVRDAGGSVYRTHGLGYLLRRNPTGHTWQVDAAYLLDPDRVAARWEGFRPSRLLEVDPVDLPAPMTGRSTPPRSP